MSESGPAVGFAEGMMAAHGACIVGYVTAYVAGESLMPVYAASLFLTAVGAIAWRRGWVNT